MFFFCKNFKQFIKFFEFSPENGKLIENIRHKKLTIDREILFNPKQNFVRHLEL